MTIKSKDIEKVQSILKSDGVVILPTETVYGLAGNAFSDRAIKKIYQVKKRPAFNPLILHIAKDDDVKKYCEWNAWAELCAKQFWPGPLTMVLPKQQSCQLSKYLGQNLDTIAIRQPAHELAQEVLKGLPFPLAAPSANLSGKVSPTHSEHVAPLLDKVDAALEGGPSLYGLESTVIDLSQERPMLLRPGFITKESLEEVLGCAVEMNFVSENPKSPGQLLSHYAPNKPVRLNCTEIKKDEGLLTFRGKNIIGEAKYSLDLSPKGCLEEAAANLYNYLQILDNKDIKRICVVELPKDGIGMAIADRLNRAALQ